MNVLVGTQRMVMDGAHFDQLTKRLSRRRIMQGLGTALVGGTLAALGQSRNTSAAKNGRCKSTPGACETCKKGKCNKKNGKKQCKAGKITPKAEGTVCSGGACQSGRCVALDGTVLTPDPAGGTSTVPLPPSPPSPPPCSFAGLLVDCSSSSAICASTAGAICDTNDTPPGNKVCCQPLGNCCRDNADCCGAGICRNGVCG
jgi:hypothetical protein